MEQKRGGKKGRKARVVLIVCMLFIMAGMLVLSGQGRAQQKAGAAKTFKIGYSRA